MEPIIVGYLAAFAIASGLVFALLLQPKRGRADGLFFAFCLGLLAWSVIALTADRQLLNSDTRFSLLLTAMSGAGGAYFLLIARLIRAENRLVTGLTLALPVAAVAALTAIWMSSAGTPEAWTTVGYGLLVTLLVYAVAAFWSMMISREEIASRLRGAGMLLVLGYGVPFASPNNLDWGLFFTAGAALWTGWIVLRAQLQQPLKELADELRIANGDLRQAVGEIATERVKAASLNEELRGATQLRSEFLEELGHRLRTPLNSISGYNQLLQSGIYGEMNEQQLERLETIGRNSQLLLEIISDMLDLSTLDAGRMELNRQAVALPTLFERIAREIEPTCSAKMLTFRIDVTPDVAPVLADESRLTQVIAHLVNNAVKYTQSGHVALRAVNAHVQSGLSAQFSLPTQGWLTDGEWVIISVEDTGVGIAPEDQGKIFDPFYQPSRASQAETMGSGLGLAISKRLIERHEGVLWLKSIPGKGSTFLIGLRAFRPAAVATSQPQSGEKEKVI